MVKHCVNLYLEAIINGLTPLGYFKFRYTENRLDLQTMHFAGLSNFVALLGGKLKSEQYISGSFIGYIIKFVLGTFDNMV